MINGIIVGVVVDNKDPDKMHRVKVEYPVVDGARPKSSWCRMMTPMGGAQRGMVMLPDLGTEVVLAFAYRSMSPYVIGAVYNLGEDRPESYHNDDKENNLRVFWSRNDHMVVFDDTPGAEQVGFAAKAGGRLDVKSGPIYQQLISSEKTIKEYCDKDVIWETVEKISIKCKTFKLTAEQSIKLESTMTTRAKAGTSVTITSGAEAKYNAEMTAINPSAPPAEPTAVEPLPEHKHPPE